jgi:hypothetical protein
MDALVMGNFVLRKKSAAPAAQGSVQTPAQQRS